MGSSMRIFRSVTGLVTGLMTCVMVQHTHLLTSLRRSKLYLLMFRMEEKELFVTTAAGHSIDLGKENLTSLTLTQTSVHILTMALQTWTTRRGTLLRTTPGLTWRHGTKVVTLPTVIGIATADSTN